MSTRISFGPRDLALIHQLTDDLPDGQEPLMAMSHQMLLVAGVLMGYAGQTDDRGMKKLAESTASMAKQLALSWEVVHRALLAVITERQEGTGPTVGPPTSLADNGEH